MRRLVGILKSDGADADRAPQPGLGQLETLLETVRGAGVPVEAVTEGEPRPLPTGLDLVVYRIVQEALTNVLKHAGPASARVTLRWGDAALDGRGGRRRPGRRSRPTDARATACSACANGSRLRRHDPAGPRPGGGFAVHARVPMERGPAA